MATKAKGDKKELYLKDLKLPKVHFDILCLPTLVFPVLSLVGCLFFAMYLHYEVIIIVVIVSLTTEMTSK